MTDLHPATEALLRAMLTGWPSSGELDAARLRWVEAGSPDVPRTGGDRFSAWLRGQREGRGFSQRELSSAIVGVRGCHQTAISRWERGEELPDAAQLGALAAAMGLGDADVAEAARLARADALLAMTSGR